MEQILFVDFFIYSIKQYSCNMRRSREQYKIQKNKWIKLFWRHFYHCTLFRNHQTTRTNRSIILFLLLIKFQPFCTITRAFCTCVTYVKKYAFFKDRLLWNRVKTILTFFSRYEDFDFCRKMNAHVTCVMGLYIYFIICNIRYLYAPWSHKQIVLLFIFTSWKLICH